MPARNSIENVINDLNERGKPFNLKVFEVEHYQNVRNSKISLLDVENNLQKKSLEKWREFFRNLEATECTQFPFSFKRFISKKRPELHERVIDKASTLNHSISNFLFNGYYGSSCNVCCLTHKKTFETINVAKYIHQNNKYGLPCCTSAFRKKRQRKKTSE